MAPGVVRSSGGYGRAVAHRVAEVLAPWLVAGGRESVVPAPCCGPCCLECATGVCLLGSKLVGKCLRCWRNLATAHLA
jgi:hypothetical protein